MVLSERPTVLKIGRTGDTFTAGYTSVIGPEVLRGSCSPITIEVGYERQVGKLVNPATFLPMAISLKKLGLNLVLTEAP